MDEHVLMNFLHLMIIDNVLHHTEIYTQSSLKKWYLVQLHFNNYFNIIGGPGRTCKLCGLVKSNIEITHLMAPVRLSSQLFLVTPKTRYKTKDDLAFVAAAPQFYSILFYFIFARFLCIVVLYLVICAAFNLYSTLVNSSCLICAYK